MGATVHRRLECATITTTGTPRRAPDRSPLPAGAGSRTGCRPRACRRPRGPQRCAGIRRPGANSRGASAYLPALSVCPRAARGLGRRGRSAARTEWRLITATHNLISSTATPGVRNDVNRAIGPRRHRNRPGCYRSRRPRVCATASPAKRECAGDRDRRRPLPGDRRRQSPAAASYLWAQQVLGWSYFAAGDANPRSGPDHVGVAATRATSQDLRQRRSGAASSALARRHRGRTPGGIGRARSHRAVGRFRVVGVRAGTAVDRLYKRP